MTKHEKSVLSIMGLSLICCLFAITCHAQKSKKLAFKDIDTHTHRVGNSPIQVFVFLEAECPISQQYIPVLNALKHSFKHTTIEWFGIFPMRGQSDETIQHFKKQYGLNFAVVNDSQHQLTNYFNAHTTPEVFVFANHKISYWGAIDDSFYELGKKRYQTNNHYLKETLAHILAKQPINIAHTEATGCDIER
jgi:peroxiredoxin